VFRGYLCQKVRRGGLILEVEVELSLFCDSMPPSGFLGGIARSFRYCSQNSMCRSVSDSKNELLINYDYCSTIGFSSKCETQTKPSRHRTRIHAVAVLNANSTLSIPRSLCHKIIALLECQRTLVQIHFIRPLPCNRVVQPRKHKQPQSSKS
jgi:hypothetical protein